MGKYRSNTLVISEQLYNQIYRNQFQVSLSYEFWKHPDSFKIGKNIIVTDFAHISSKIIQQMHTYTTVVLDTKFRYIDKRLLVQHILPYIPKQKVSPLFKPFYIKDENNLLMIDGPDSEVYTCEGCYTWEITDETVKESLNREILVFKIRYSLPNTRDICNTFFFCDIGRKHFLGVPLVYLNVVKNRSINAKYEMFFKCYGLLKRLLSELLLKKVYVYRVFLLAANRYRETPLHLKTKIDGEDLQRYSGEFPFFCSVLTFSSIPTIFTPQVSISIDLLQKIIPLLKEIRKEVKVLPFQLQKMISRNLSQEIQTVLQKEPRFFFPKIKGKTCVGFKHSLLLYVPRGSVYYRRKRKEDSIIPKHCEEVHSKIIKVLLKKKKEVPWYQLYKLVYPTSKLSIEKAKSIFKKAYKRSFEKDYKTYKRYYEKIRERIVELQKGLEGALGNREMACNILKAEKGRYKIDQQAMKNADC